jgi:hypothetical protein
VGEKGVEQKWAGKGVGQEWAGKGWEVVGGEGGGPEVGGEGAEMSGLHGHRREIYRPTLHTLARCLGGLVGPPHKID